MGLFNNEDMDSKIMDEIESEMNERFEELDNLKNLVQTDLALESMMINLFIETNTIIEFIKREFGEEKYKNVYLPIKELVKKHETVQLLLTNHQKKLEDLEKMKKDLDSLRMENYGKW